MRKRGNALVIGSGMAGLAAGVTVIRDSGSVAVSAGWSEIGWGRRFR